MSIKQGGNTIAGATNPTTLLNAIYPVGSIYIGTQSTCPLSTLISNSTWEIVATNRALWGGNGTNANTTIAAGLPNITGSFGRVASANNVTSGAFTTTSGSENHGASGNKLGYVGYSLDASRSSSIYGNSSTVQPPAYVVNVWRRTA